eukprot:jgi/Chlat1/8538/Chrsp82S07972
MDKQSDQAPAEVEAAALQAACRAAAGGRLAGWTNTWSVSARLSGFLHAAHQAAQAGEVVASSAGWIGQGYLSMTRIGAASSALVWTRC